MKNSIIFLLLMSSIVIKAMEKKENEFKALWAGEQILADKIKNFTGHPRVIPYVRDHQALYDKKIKLVMDLTPDRRNELIASVKKDLVEKTFAYNVKQFRGYFDFIVKNKSLADYCWNEIEEIPDSLLLEDAIQALSFEIGDSGSQLLVLRYFEDVKSVYISYKK